ncbi:MAG: hypothetical protein AAGG75_10430 [Bacteroidota bacterium]
MATAISKLTLYSDSTFTQPTSHYYEEGQLFEVIGESQLEHEDDAQNQKFKWYEVRAADGHSGWVFGDGLAVSMTAEQVAPILQEFHKKKYSFNNGFESATLWVAAVEGRDNFHAQDYMNPLYREEYIVITNDRGRSVHIRSGGLSTQGEFQLLSFVLHDISGDHVPEIILETNSIAQDNPVQNRNLGIYSFQAGTLEQVLEERLTLNYDIDIPSPCLYKFVEIEQQAVRIEYVDYVDCKTAYSLDYSYNMLSKTKERCMEYVTYTYIWDDRVNSFRLLYDQTRTAPIAGVKQFGLAVQETPKLSSQRGSIVQLEEPVEVIKHFEKYVLERGQKKLQHYFYVRLPSGEQGYLPAAFVGFVDMEHAELLNQYYEQPPLTKSEWSSQESFLKIPLSQLDSATTDQ